MAETPFNVSDLIRRLGLKNVSGLPIEERITPTVNVGSLEGLTPSLVPPSALFADTTAAVAARVGLVEVQSLSPGGLWIENVFFNAAFTSALVYSLRQVPDLSFTGALTATIVASNEPFVSQVFMGDIAPSGLRGLTVTLNPDPRGNFGPWYIPRGDVFRLEGTVVNQIFGWGIFIREVPATEHAPS